MAEWDIRTALRSMAADAGRLKPVLEQLKPREWVAKGAPDTYVKQLESAQSQIQGVVRSTEILAKDPEKLTAALDTFLRLQALESVLASVAEGVRKYQNPALADLLRVARQYLDPDRVFTFRVEGDLKGLVKKDKRNPEDDAPLTGQTETDPPAPERPGTARPEKYPAKYANYSGTC